MLRLVNRNQTPPGGFRFRVDPQGKRFHGWTLYAISKSVEDFHTANNLPVPPALGELIEDFTCAENKGEGCESGDPIADFARTLVLSWKVLVAGTTSVGAWFLAGRPKVAQEVADARSEVCVGCVYNEDPQGCQPCQLGALHKLVKSLVGQSKTVNDHKLRACSRCGCALSVKVWVPLEHLTKAKPLAPLPEWCWLTKEGANG